MKSRAVISKHIDLDRIRRDINSRELTGVHLWECEEPRKEDFIVEAIYTNYKHYAYSVKIHTTASRITKVERVKFQWECGGWRGADHIIDRLPPSIAMYERNLDNFFEDYVDWDEHKQ